MVKGVLLDSVILIDHLNGVPDATAYIARLRREDVPIWISGITRAEVLVGTKSEYEFAVLGRLLDSFKYASMTEDVADSAARIRKTMKLRLPDALQLAHASHQDLNLATRNTKDFQIKDPRIEVPYTL